MFGAGKQKLPPPHTVLKNPLGPPFPQGHEVLCLGMGCFWGAERKFWQQPGVWTTAVGYAGGQTANPTYEDVCSGRTGHAEVVLVVYDPKVLSTDKLLHIFWESHDPTQGNRQGNDVGSQYRSCLYFTTPLQRNAIDRSKLTYNTRLQAAGFGLITTEVRESPPFWYAETYHQQYLDKNPNGYCGLGGTGVLCHVPGSV